MKRICKQYQNFRLENIVIPPSNPLKNHGKNCPDCADFDRFLNALPQTAPVSIPAPDGLLRSARLQAEGILKERRERKDGLLFIGTCLCLLAAAGGLLYSGGGLVLLGIEAFFALFFPIGIPLILIRRKKERASL